GRAGRVQGPHLNLNRLVRVRELAVPRRLLDQLTAVRQDERAVAAACSRVNLVDELSEDNLAAVSLKRPLHGRAANSPSCHFPWPERCRRVYARASETGARI